MLQRLKDRVSKLENSAAFKEYENGAWTIIKRTDTHYSLHTSRLGRFEFNTREELNDFIKKHHRGAPPNWSFNGFLEIEFV